MVRNLYGDKISGILFYIDAPKAQFKIITEVAYNNENASVPVITCIDTLSDS